WGIQSSSRLGYNGHQFADGILYGGGRNPDPVYYQYLPSYALRNQNNLDYERAYLLREDLIDGGQLDWLSLYRANQTKSGFAIYSLYDDVQKLSQ
ncbi:MAG: TonB-dependent receptor, partial [Flavobacteriaceae bacterium]|nr:TonB-dependent receptor [Flavobacteriaceae bacterium]